MLFLCLLLSLPFAVKGRPCGAYKKRLERKDILICLSPLGASYQNIRSSLFFITLWAASFLLLFVGTKSKVFTHSAAHQSA